MTNKLSGASLGLLLALGGCAGKSANNPADQPSVDGGGSGGGFGGSGGASATGGGGAASTCPSSIALTSAATGRVDIPVRVTANHVPMVLGVAGAGRDGREYRLSLFKMFLAEPSLVDANGAETKAQFVGPDGAPLPYGLALIDVEDPGSQLLHLAAPQGAYSALHFGVGVPETCNSVAGTDRVYPLNPDSDMFWPWGSQFMFIRAEGATKLPSTDWTSFAYHVGFAPSYANITVVGSVTLGVSGQGPTLSLEVDRLLATDAATLPAPKHAGPDGWVVDNLENPQTFSLE